MDKYTADKYSFLGYLLRQTGFKSLEDYVEFREETLKEMEKFISQNRKDKKNVE